MKQHISANVATALVLGVFYLVGLVGHLVPEFRPLMQLLTPWFLFFSGLAVAALAVRGQEMKTWLPWVALVLVATFFLEALGVATGLVFGPYMYSTALGALYFHVPPVIGWNWVLVVWGCHATVARVAGRAPSVVRAFMVGSCAVVFDVVLEPVAQALGYWTWLTPQVPLQNYVAWGLIATVASWWGSRFPTLARGSAPTINLAYQFVFFLALGWAGVSF